MNTLAQLFPDLYDPAKSFWLHEELTNIEFYRQIDGYFAVASPHAALRIARTLAKTLPHPNAFLARLIYNQLYLRHIPPEVYAVDLNKLGDVYRRTRCLFHQLYGLDLTKTETSIRNAKPSDPYHNYRTDGTDIDTNILYGMHLDRMKGVTTIIYLNDVGEKNGCFAWLEGSELIPRSLAIRSMQETISQMHYGTRLPPWKARQVLPFIHKVVGPAGTAVTFTGNTLVHGGGHPYEGVRSAKFIAHTGLVMHRVKSKLPYYLALAGL